MARLEKTYKEKIVPGMMSEFEYANKMQVPKIEKIVVSMGVGKATKEKKAIEGATRDLAQITGQKPLVCKARKSVSNFKLREGMEIGLKVTLRGRRMYEFLDRMISLVLPRVRDFRGLNPNAFDGQGNYNLGFTEQMAFPEIDPDKIDNPQGMNVALVTTAKTDNEALRLLKLFGVPLRDS